MNARAKGIAFERDVAKTFEAHGFKVRGLERGGDLIVLGHGLTLQVETKRWEQAQVGWWLKQLDRDALGVLQMLVWKQSRKPAFALVEFEPLVAAFDGRAT